MRAADTAPWPIQRTPREATVAAPAADGTIDESSAAEASAWYAAGWWPRLGGPPGGGRIAPASPAARWRVTYRGGYPRGMRILLLLSLVACGRHADVETDIEVGTVTLAGTATEFGFGNALGADNGACASLVEHGGDELADEVAVEDNGSFALPVDLPLQGAVYVQVESCGDGVWIPMANPVPAELLEALADGDTVEVPQAMTMSQNSLTPLMGSFQTAGGEGSPLDSGALIGGVRDANGQGVGGATIACGCGEAVYYADQEVSDGLFNGADGSVNTVTSERMSGFYLASPAPMGSWRVDAEGYAFEAVELGAWAGVLVGYDFTAGSDPT